MRQFKDSPVKCPDCGKIFKNANSLSSHQRQQCGIQPKYNCNICLKKFKRNHNLKRHILQVHRDFLSPESSLIHVIESNVSE
ncbi:hypothetical protein JTB14_033829 [Gonioctena quinquepunctata]|nr:hypothetical protein JTB14_033829 [Gonioctena quinquepunctata]